MLQYIDASGPPASLETHEILILCDIACLREARMKESLSTAQAIKT